MSFFKKPYDQVDKIIVQLHLSKSFASVSNIVNILKWLKVFFKNSDKGSINIEISAHVQPIT